MTGNEFRRLALSFPETAESAQMGHPDFRVAGKIFATLSYPDKGWAMVKAYGGTARGTCANRTCSLRAREGRLGSKGSHASASKVRQQDAGDFRADCGVEKPGAYTTSGTVSPNYVKLRYYERSSSPQLDKLYF